MEYKKISHEINNVVSDNVNILAQLFPSAVKDGQVDFTALKEELGQFEEVGKEKYELTWSGKQNAKKKAKEDVYNRTLKYIEKDSKNPETTENLYIEGDNLEVLKLLRQNYYGTIKMIYIDPPYNTGSDFIYNDNFTMSQEDSDIAEGTRTEDNEKLQKNQKSTNRYHANWLNMMYPRLKIAKDLLSDDGVIFISIDDNEIANLRKLCDDCDLFGEENLAVQFLWTKTSTPPSLAYKCRKTVEYVLAYEKVPNNSKYFGAFLDNGDAPLLNSGNPIKTLIFKPGTVKFTYINNETIKNGNYEKAMLEKDVVVKNGFNETEVVMTAEFKWDQKNLNNEIQNGTYFLVKSNKMSIRFQRVTNDDSYKTPNNFLDIALNKDSNIGTNETAVKEVTALNLEKYFDFPKPTSLIKKLLLMKTFNDKNATILDFFSGSSTTAHAVMQLNAEDGGNRKFIMVQLPEETEENSEAYKANYKNICEIGKERIRRAGEKIKKEIEEENAKIGLLEEPKQVPDIGFKVYRTGDTNIKWNLSKALGQINYDDVVFSPDTIDFVMGSNDIDVVYEIMLRQKDVALSENLEVLTYIGDRTYLYASSYLICLETKITEALIEKLSALEPLPIKFIFRDSAFGDDIDFKDYTFRKLGTLIEKNSGETKKTYTVEFI